MSSPKMIVILPPLKFGEESPLVKEFTFVSSTTLHYAYKTKIIYYDKNSKNSLNSRRRYWKGSYAGRCTCT